MTELHVPRSLLFAAAAGRTRHSCAFSQPHPDGGAQYGEDRNPETWRNYSGGSLTETGRRLRGRPQPALATRIQASQ
jgi:hypothetical protein